LLNHVGEMWEIRVDDTPLCHGLFADTWEQTYCVFTWNWQNIIQTNAFVSTSVDYKSFFNTTVMHQNYSADPLTVLIQKQKMVDFPLKVHLTWRKSATKFILWILSLPATELYDIR